MLYKALKPFSMSGKGYLVDDEVDVSKITELQIDSLIKRKYIVGVNPAKQEDNVPQVISIDVPIIEKDSTLTVSLTSEQIIEVFTVLQNTVEDATALIFRIESEDELIVIHQLDTRKGVKAAAKEQAEELAKKAEAENPAPAGSIADGVDKDADKDGSGEE